MPHEVALNWREAFIRAARTFFQTFGGALTGITIYDGVTGKFATDVAWKLAGPAIGAFVGAGAAFFQNLGGVSELPSKDPTPVTVANTSQDPVLVASAEPSSEDVTAKPLPGTEPTAFEDGEEVLDGAF